MSEARRGKQIPATRACPDSSALHYVCQLIAAMRNTAGAACRTALTAEII
jgi:hypothetical protein